MTATVVVIPTTLLPFPYCPTYGFNAQPWYLVNINSREGGFENIEGLWDLPLNVYTAVPIAPTDEADIQEILYFWHAMGAQEKTFIIKDWSDYKSCDVQNTPSRLDQGLQAITLDDASTGYQLVKEYTVDGITQIRNITQPIGSTILIANGSGVAQTDFAVDESTGLMKPGGTFSGTPLTWGGEFNVPVRFDGQLSLQIVDKQIQGASFTLREKRQTQATKITVPPPPGSQPITFTDVATAPVGLDGLLYAGSAGVILGWRNLTGNAYRSTDNGVTWSASLSSLSGFANSFGLNKTSGVILCGGSGTVKRSTDGGATFGSSITVGSIGIIQDLACDNAGNWVAMGGSGITAYAYSNDDGVTWHAPGTFINGSWTGYTAFWDPHNSQFVALGAQHTTNKPAVYTSPDGQTWTETLFSTPFSRGGPKCGYDSVGAAFAMICLETTNAKNVRVDASNPKNWTTVTGIVSGVGTAAGDSSNLPESMIFANGTIFVFGGFGSMFSSSDLGSTWAQGNTSFPIGGSIDLMGLAGACYDDSNRTVTIVGHTHGTVSTYTFP